MMMFIPEIEVDDHFTRQEKLFASINTFASCESLVMINNEPIRKPYKPNDFEPENVNKVIALFGISLNFAKRLLAFEVSML